MELRLQPNGSGFEYQTVVKLLGDGGVQFQHCILTLDGQQMRDGDKPVPLAVVTLAGSRETKMQMGSASSKVIFDSCFIRGKGDLVLSRANRPFKLDMKDSLAALTGSLLNVDAGDGADVAAPSGQKVIVQLKRVTAYLGGHLGRLHAANLSSLVPMECRPENSFLVAAGDRRKALVHLEGGSSSDKDMARSRLSLTGASNQYANFSPMMDQQPDNEPAAAVVTREAWKEENESRATKFEDHFKFSDQLWTDSSDNSAANVSLKNFRTPDAAADKGVNLNKLPEAADSRDR